MFVNVLFAFFLKQYACCTVAAETQLFDEDPAKRGLGVAGCSAFWPIASGSILFTGSGCGYVEGNPEQEQAPN